MKKTIIFLYVITLSIIIFEGCFKKGPDDPFISLRTRKTRVVADWTVSSGSGTKLSGMTTNPTTENWTYSNPTLTTTNGSTISQQNITYKYSFNKDGTWNSTQTSTGTTYGIAYTDVVTESGNWDFGGGIGDVKKKTELVLSILASTDTHTSGGTTTATTKTYTGQDDVTVYDIDELKNKKMILVWDNSSISGTTINSDQGQYTLTQ